MTNAAPEDYTSRAQRHWTDERLRKITGGRKWTLLPHEAPLLLRQLGLLNSDASMSADSVRKFSQINHMLTLLLPALEDLRTRHRVVRVIDAGCGNSYLTFLLAWLFKDKWQKDVQIVGIDTRPDVIASSAKKSMILGYEAILRFEVTPITPDYATTAFGRLFPDTGSGDAPRANLIVALHACDTATDDALAMAVEGRADVFALAPCCHAALARKWRDHDFSAHSMGPMFNSPHLRREAAALFTDTLRMLYARAHGYEVTVTEFVPSEHTPKNRLLLCVRRGRFLTAAAEQYQRLVSELGGHGLDLPINTVP